jgi:hypothetical protein
VKRIPHARDVRKALRSVRAAAQQSLAALNEVAGQRMTKGDYLAAEELAAMGKVIRQFQSEADALRERWREICGGGAAARKSVTPLWAFYQPILEALMGLGGESPRAEIETQVERLIAPSLMPGDRTPMARGRERWRVMIQRARKPLASEGWIETGGGATWKITEVGRKAAAKIINKDPSKRS